MKKAALLVVAAGTAVVVAGAAYAWVEHQSAAELQAATDQIRAQLGPNGSFSYKSSHLSPLRRSARLSTVVLRTARGALFTAEQVTVAGVGQNGASAIHVRGLRASDAAATVVLTAATLDGRDVAVSPPRPGDPAAAGDVTLAWASLGDVALATAQGSATASEVVVNDYGVGRASMLQIRAASVATPGVEHLDHLGFAWFRSTGIDLASAVGAFRRGTGAPRRLAGPFTLTVDGIYGADGPNKPVVIRALTAAGITAADGASSNGRTSLVGVRIQPVTEQARRQLAQIGLDAIGGELSVGTSFRRAGGHFEITPSVEVDGLGKLALGVTFANMDLMDVSSNNTPSALVKLFAMIQRAKLVSASLHLSDAGLLDRLLDMEARQTGRPKEQLRDLVLLRINQDPTLGAVEGGERIRTGLSSYVAHGHDLSVAVRPASPMSLPVLFQNAQLNPPGLLSQLGVTVSGD